MWASRVPRKADDCTFVAQPEAAFCQKKKNKNQKSKMNENISKGELCCLPWQDMAFSCLTATTYDILRNQYLVPVEAAWLMKRMVSAGASNSGLNLSLIITLLYSFLLIFSFIKLGMQSRKMILNHKTTKHDCVARHSYRLSPSGRQNIGCNWGQNGFQSSSKNQKPLLPPLLTSFAAALTTTSAKELANCNHEDNNSAKIRKL